ncbi:LysM peptidoglycan-binding domain-containing protein [Adhaeribacter rhizoryzae]|uniref:LysM peptidoglycan-binding domain-containing protein n=1 Tax=Adhaeribacter rhizoryzae TaxID=2607907 RepID=A0A5M6DQP0_9BACT|nr:LysM peptidoglycan-binding domain-containing protein [Adhaeribacter rhizoryzae]KAA5548559.1 LysM peptidoglycan-binding domain-containing protein [Adhaeribacter rhizoryzae]
MRWGGSFLKVIGRLTFFLTGVVFAPTAFAQAIPDAASVGNTATDFHLVQQGDTYYRLSRLYKVPVYSLQHWNGPDLKLGTTIRVKPEAASNVAAEETVPVEPAHKPTESPVVAPAKNSLSSAKISSGNRVVVVPFDPALYFSDADNDIAWQSKVEKQKIRYIFQARLNALLQAPGYQSINLVNVPVADSVYNPNNIYKQLSYSYQNIKTSAVPAIAPPKEKGLKAWVKNTREKVGISKTEEPVGVAYDETKYYGVRANDPDLFATLSNSIGANYFIFINQFEIFTDYNNCIDRTTKNFVRNFRVHYTIYNAQGDLVAGNKILIPYESNVNDINKITRDNLGKMASRIMADLPPPSATDTSEARN